jgi:multiple sugar transport system substrate-binding protein/raffinose/stachyose/melibiose transport system substrate-binding protein
LRHLTFDGVGRTEELLMEQFEAVNPHITVETQTYQRGPHTYLADAPPPDLMLIAPSQYLDEAIDQGGLTDLTDLWQETGLADNYPVNLARLSERDGKQYFMPLGYSWNGFYYNKELFDDLGLQPPQTWDEFIELCETLWLNGVTPLSISGQDPFMGSLWIDYLALRLYGPDFHRALREGRIPYDDPQVRTIFEYWRSLVESGYFLPNAGAIGALTSLTAVTPESVINTGAKAAMILSGPAYMDELPAPLRNQLGYFPFPVMDPDQQPGEVVLSIGYMTPANAPHRAEAIDFLRFLASDEVRSALGGDDLGNASYALIAESGERDAGQTDEARQGVELIQRTDALVPPYFLSIPDGMWPTLVDVMRRLLAAPSSESVFDLESVLADLEVARPQ